LTGRSILPTPAKIKKQSGETMAVKLLALYTRPADEAAFLEHYNNVHLPLVTKVPGLQAIVVNKIEKTLMGGDAPYFMIAELHFSDQAAFDAAMASPENRAAGKDVMTFAKGLVTMLVATD
jgi:uncharacterized protein (TIGR02118 family)